MLQRLCFVAEACIFTSFSLMNSRYYFITHYLSGKWRFRIQRKRFFNIYNNMITPHVVFSTIKWVGGTTEFNH